MYEAQTYTFHSTQDSFALKHRKVGHNIEIMRMPKAFEHGEKLLESHIANYRF